MSSDMASYLDPGLCANLEQVVNGEASPCQKDASIVWANCGLVQINEFSIFYSFGIPYCSKECKVAHWTDHKKFCESPLLDTIYVPSWVVERQVPAFLNTGVSPQLRRTTWFGTDYYLWGSMPALDILNLKEKEGANEPIMRQDLNLLFAASGDLRIVVKTVVKLPENYVAKCTIILNDLNFHIVARNIILLLVALHFKPDEATPIMIHLWYSAMLPSAMVQKLREEILPYVEDVNKKIKRKPAQYIHAKAFTFDSASLRVVLSRADWRNLKSHFSVPQFLTVDRAKQLRRNIIEAPERVDFIDRSRYLKSPAWRAGMTRFREDGILLPYASSREKFDTPNPTFFQDSKQWPMNWDAEPLSGWARADYSAHTPPAKGNMYGGLFFLLRDMFKTFCNRLHQSNIAFHANSVNAKGIQAHLRRTDLGTMLFDRIEVSNISDRYCIGPTIALSTFMPLLKPKFENPHATLLLLFMNAVGEESQRTMEAEEPAMDIIGRFLTPSSFEVGEKFKHLVPRDINPEWERFWYVDNFFLDHDKAFEAFLKKEHVQACADRLGVKLKHVHSIVAKWPLRVWETSSIDWFEIVSATGHASRERYIEVERVDPAEEQESFGSARLKSKVETAFKAMAIGEGVVPK